METAGTLLILACVNAAECPAQTQPAGSNRDYLVGWYELPPRKRETGQVVPGPGTLIPVLKIDGAYCSLCRGVEVPFKECPEGLEWASKPSSMTGTTIGFDKVANKCYIRIVDGLLEHNDQFYVAGEKQFMRKVDKPSWLPDPTARPPRTIDDLLGFYQLAWAPGIGFDIRREGGKYLSTSYELQTSGSWKAWGTGVEYVPLPDRLGLTGPERRKNAGGLTYNEARRRFEITFGDAPVLRMPFARISPTSSSQSGAVPLPRQRVGIPSWH